MKVSAQYAEEHFAEIAHTVMRGEDVDIAFPDDAALRVTLLKPAAPFKRTTPRILGEGAGEMTVPSWEEWKAIDKELEREVNEHPLDSEIMDYDVPTIWN